MCHSWAAQNTSGAKQTLKDDSKAPWFGLLPSTELQDASSLLDRPAVHVLKVHRHHHLTGLRKAPVPYEG